VAFLTALVAAILVRALRADLSRYNNNGNGNGIGVGSSSSSSSSPSRLDLDLGGLDGDFDDETGWKVLSGDVFRTPKRLPLLSALVGTGAQLCLLAFLTSAAAAARGSSLFEDRGSVATVAVVLYALTSVVGGFVAGETFTRFSSNGGSSGGGGSLGGRAGSSTTATTSKRAQARTWLLAATLLPLSSLAVGAFVNSVALLYRSSAAVPFRGVAGVSALWLLLSAPLCRLGFAAGRKRWQRRRLGEAAGGGRAGDPTRTKRVPSPIPSKPWHRSRAFVCLLAGLLPFLSILVVRRKREERKERERERERKGGKRGPTTTTSTLSFPKNAHSSPSFPLHTTTLTQSINPGNDLCSRRPVELQGPFCPLSLDSGPRSGALTRSHRLFCNRRCLLAALRRGPQVAFGELHGRVQPGAVPVRLLRPLLLRRHQDDGRFPGLLLFRVESAALFESGDGDGGRGLFGERRLREEDLQVCQVRLKIERGGVWFLCVKRRRGSEKRTREEEKKRRRGRGRALTLQEFARKKLEKKPHSLKKTKCSPCSSPLCAAPLPLRQELSSRLSPRAALDEPTRLLTET